jgi:hypothetical protein
MIALLTSKKERIKMKLTILNHTGDTVLTDKPLTDSHDRVKEMTTKEIKAEFDKLVKEGYTPINDKTNKIVKGRITKSSEITMLYPVIGG